MKYLILLLFPVLVHAEEKEWTFVYKSFQSIKYFQCTAKGTWEFAFELCAKTCARTLSNNNLPLTEDKKLEIVDICANPR